ncbi:G5 domain-containing protein [Streptococcus gordonii]|uniref:G5 domain-containing protein n=10 Tax=Streptococcus gordonii TaxID=1302 RepID=UPI000DA29BD7|nr:G5 domain-containing protein [Streptococcus gordonii]QWZ57832.1 G5 domain-containing protein [Streptococcus gordonii]SQF29792.1 LPXTG cell wall surface protein [Streptococcus gordonii]
MDRKKLIKLGISVLAVNALGAVAVYKYPELTHVPTVYAEEQPGEDEEIPDAAEAQAAANFKNQMDEFEKAINEFNPDDSDTKESLQYALEDAEGYHTTAVNAIKSEEGKKGFAKYEARYQALKAKAQALLNGESPKPQPEITTQDVTVKEPILYGSSTVKNPALPKGTRNTKVQGVNGEKEVVYTITLTDGKETGRVKKSETVIKPAVDEVIEEGTGAVTTTEEVVEKEVIKHGSSTVQNPALPKGTRNTKVQGVDGEKEVTYTVTKEDGVQVSKVKKSEKVTKPAVDEVIEEGTGAVTTTEEVVEKEVIKHGSSTVQNPALPKGTRNTKVQGVDGEKEVTYTVTKADGVQVSKVKKSEKVTKPAVDEVIEEGTGAVTTTEEVVEKEVIKHGSSTVQNPALPKGTRNTKVQGVDGEKEVTYTVTKADGVQVSKVKKSEKVTKPAVDEVIEEGTGAVTTTEEVVEKEVIKHGSSTVQNPALPKGTRNIKVQGVDGEKEVTYTVTKADGVQVSKVKKSETVTKPAVDEVIEEGTGPVVITKEETKTEEVDFQVKEVPNPALPEGVRNVTTPGKKGVRTIVETVTYTDGKETGRVVKSNEITTPAVDEVVEVGTKKGVVTTTEEVVEKEVIKHGSSTVQNPALPKGTRNVKVQGVDGEKEVTYTVTKADGVQVSKVKKSETVTKPAVDEVIEEGTGPVITTKEETKTEEVDFQVKEVQNPALPEGVRNVTTPGKKGVRTIVYTVTYADGVETGRVEKSNTITTPAVDEVVEVGTKKATAPVVTTENVTETQVIYHGTITLSNPDLPKGTKRIKIAGVDGEKTVVYTITKTNGVETSRVVRDEQITKTPITQVVEIGTKESGSSQSNASQDQKDPSDKAQDSKGQGQKDSTGKVQDPKDQVKPGSDTATSSQSGQTDRPQQPQYSRVNRNAEEKKNLPNTGEHANGLAALLGLVLASVTAFFNFRRKKH